MTADDVTLIQHQLNELESPSRPLTSWEKKFLEDVTRQFDERGYLTEGQMIALARVYKDRCE